MLFSQVKCVNCGDVGHRIRNCNKDSVAVLCANFGEVSSLTLNNFVKNCRSVDLSVLMIHHYDATNVSMKKQEKIDFITQRWIEDREQLLFVSPLATPPHPTTYGENNYSMDGDWWEALHANIEMEPTEDAWFNAATALADFVPSQEYPVGDEDVWLNAATALADFVPTQEYPDEDGDWWDALNTNPLQSPIQGVNLFDNYEEEEDEGTTQILNISENVECGDESVIIECIICYESQPETMVATVNCGHQTCVDCMIKLCHTQQQNGRFVNCPYCRTQVSDIMIHDINTYHQFVEGLNQLG
jgi:hypothetical protein